MKKKIQGTLTVGDRSEEIETESEEREIKEKDKKKVI